MKKIILILILITINLFSSEIENTCSQQWGTNYRMVKYCIKTQTEAKNSINSSRNSSEIENSCRNNWGTDYRMVQYCIKEQTKARNNINESKTDADRKIEAYCRGTWGTDYRMVQYCIDDLTSSKDSLKANGLSFLRVENGSIVAQSIANAEKEKKVEQVNQAKKIRKQDNVIEEPNIIRMTEAEEAELLKKKYKNTPTIYIKGRIIYDVLDISYFRNDKTKIMIIGKEQNYFFPIIVLKEARFENATDELKQKLDSLIKNSN